MFVHVVRAPAADPGPLLEQVARLPAMLGTEAAGFLGLTAGISDEGDFVAVARFASPGGDAWWAALEPWLAGPPTVRASSEVELLLGGGSDEAGFIEVIEGHATDRHRFMVLERQLEQRFAAERPDFLGSQIIWWADGSWLEVAYFTSEDDLRAADARGLSPEVEELVSAWEGVARPSAQLDLADPFLSSGDAMVWVVAGCLFEVSLPGEDWQWVDGGPEVTLLAEDERGGRSTFASGRRQPERKEAWWSCGSSAPAPAPRPVRCRCGSPPNDRDLPAPPRPPRPLLGAARHQAVPCRLEPGPVGGDVPRHRLPQKQVGIAVGQEGGGVGEPRQVASGWKQALLMIPAPELGERSLGVLPAGLGRGGDRWLRRRGLLGDIEQRPRPVHERRGDRRHQPDAFVERRCGHRLGHPAAPGDGNRLHVTGDRHPDASPQEVGLGGEAHVHRARRQTGTHGDIHEGGRRIAALDEQRGRRFDQAGFGLGSACRSQIALDRFVHRMQYSCIDAV